MPPTPSLAGTADASPRWLSLRERAVALLVGTGAFGVLALASRLEPSPFGLGTHQQLGLPACSWPMAMGLPCPSCGMTTAFAHAARGDLLSSFAAQPFGAVLALATAMVVVVSFFSALSGTRAFALFAPIGSKAGVAAAVGLLLAAWGYKIAEFRGWLG